MEFVTRLSVTAQFPILGNRIAERYRAATQIRASGMQKTTHSRAYRKLLSALKSARERAGMTQGEVAERLGGYASFVSKVESGERRLDVVELAALCKLYGADLIALLRGAGLIV